MELEPIHWAFLATAVMSFLLGLSFRKKPRKEKVIVKTRHGHAGTKYVKAQKDKISGGEIGKAVELLITRMASDKFNPDIILAVGNGGTMVSAQMALRIPEIMVWQIYATANGSGNRRVVSTLDIMGMAEAGLNILIVTDHVANEEDAADFKSVCRHIADYFFNSEVRTVELVASVPEHHSYSYYLSNANKNDKAKKTKRDDADYTMIEAHRRKVEMPWGTSLPPGRTTQRTFEDPKTGQDADGKGSDGKGEAPEQVTKERMTVNEGLADHVYALTHPFPTGAHLSANGVGSLQPKDPKAA